MNTWPWWMKPLTTKMSLVTENNDATLMQLRSYQAEMLEESLKGNVVVVVWNLRSQLCRGFSSPSYRWTLGAARLWCKSPWYCLDIFWREDRAQWRIMEELKQCRDDQVCSILHGFRTTLTRIDLLVSDSQCCSGSPTIWCSTERAHNVQSSAPKRKWQCRQVDAAKLVGCSITWRSNCH